MILTKRGSNEMYLDYKDVKVLPKHFVDALERQLDRAMRMVPAQDVLNMHLQSGNYAEYDRNEAQSDVLRKALNAVSDNQAIINDLKAVVHTQAEEVKAKDAKIAALEAK